MVFLESIITKNKFNFFEMTLPLYDLYLILFTISIFSGFLLLYLSYIIRNKFIVTKKVKIARTLIQILLCAVIWIFCFGFSLFLYDKMLMYYLFAFSYIGVSFIGPLWFIFSCKWTGSLKAISSYEKAIFIIPSIFLFLVLTNPLHNLIFSNIDFIYKESLLLMNVESGILWYVFVFILYGHIILGIILLIRYILSARGIYKTQAMIMTIGTVIPLLVNLISLIFFSSSSYQDTTPIFFVITGLLYYMGLSKKQLIDIIPVARDTIFDTIQDPVIVLNTSKKIVDANPSAKKLMYRESGEEIIGKKIDELSPILGNLVTKYFDETSSHEEKYLTLNQTRFYFDIQIVDILDSQKQITGKIITLRDITARKKAEEELQNTKDDLDQLNKNLEDKVQKRTEEISALLKQKDDFVTQLGHDLRTPLGPIISLLPIVDKYETNTKSKDMLDIIIKNTDRMKTLVSKTIKLAQLNAPETSLILENVNLYYEFENAFERIKPQIIDKNITVENNIDTSLLIRVDKVQFSELLDNILTNAVKYNMEDGLISIDAKEENEQVTLVIKDTGIGMTEEELHHLFEEFFKADESRHDIDSSGLGMSISKRIVEKHGGDIWVESAGLGKGSTIHISIPLSLKKNINF